MEHCAKNGSSLHLTACLLEHVTGLCLPHLQAAMCYVHVAALVAEYLWRKGELRMKEW